LSVDSNNKLRGSIINLGTTLMKDVTVRGQVWTWNIGDLPPGANNINAGAASGVAPAGQPGELAHPPFMGQPRTQDGYDALGDLADRRSRQIDAAITEGHRVCVYARVENPAALATQQVPGALMSNWEIIRSLVTLEPEATTSAP